MKNQIKNPQEDSFAFRFPRMLRSALEGGGFLIMTLLVFWVPATFLSDLLSETWPVYFLIFSHAVGVPVGFWLYQRPRAQTHCVPEQRRSNVVDFVIYVETRKAA